jgi:hypothetical protein
MVITTNIALKLKRPVHENAAQHRVHPNPGNVRRGHGGGTLRVFRQFSWLEVGSAKAALSRPAHQYPEGA